LSRDHDQHLALRPASSREDLWKKDRTFSGVRRKDSIDDFKEKGVVNSDVFIEFPRPLMVSFPGR
jgi:hypothetical protein